MSLGSVAREEARVKRAVLTGQRAQDALAALVCEVAGLAARTGAARHARHATQVARLAADLHVVTEEMAEGGALW